MVSASYSYPTASRTDCLEARHAGRKLATTPRAKRPARPAVRANRKKKFSPLLNLSLTIGLPIALLTGQAARAACAQLSALIS